MPDRLGYYLAVDGYPARCLAQIYDQDGRLLGSGRSGSANLRIGGRAAMSSIEIATTKALKQAGLAQKNFSDLRAGLALPGGHIHSLRREFIAQGSPFLSLQLISDTQAACIGAHAGQDGGLITLDILSSGIAYHEGQTSVIDGWEFPLAGYGGGAQLGLRLMQKCLAAQDGLGPSSELTKQIMGSFQDSPESVSQWARLALPSEYARYAPVVFEAAWHGDEIAIELIDELLAHVERMLKAIVSLGVNKIVMAGEFSKFVRPLLDPFWQSMLIEPQGDTILGALLVAGISPANTAHLVIAQNPPKEPSTSTFGGAATISPTIQEEVEALVEEVALKGEVVLEDTEVREEMKPLEEVKAQEEAPAQNEASVLEEVETLEEVEALELAPVQKEARVLKEAETHEEVEALELAPVQKEARVVKEAETHEEVEASEPINYLRA